MPDGLWDLPLHNVWLGTSVEDQTRADQRLPALLETPAAVRWVSAEPLLGPVDLERWLHVPDCLWEARSTCTCHITAGPRLDWVVVGGESGPHARPMDPGWARSLRDQTRNSMAAFFLKQWGGRNPKSGGRELDGRTWDQYPNDVKVST
jgi:protein gp37